MTAETRISVCCLHTFDRHLLSVRLLVYTVLLHLHKRLALGSFFRLIEEGGPRLALASKLLQVYAREQDREMLRDFYYSDDRRVDSAILALEEATDMGVRWLVLFPHLRLLTYATGPNFQSYRNKERAEVLFGG